MKKLFVFTSHINFDPIFSIALSNGIYEKGKKKTSATLPLAHSHMAHTLKHRNTDTVGTRERHRNLFFRVVHSHFTSILLDLLSYSTVNSYLYIFFFFFHRVKFIYNAKWAQLLL